MLSLLDMTRDDGVVGIVQMRAWLVISFYLNCLVLLCY
mgnify:CR=1 FL=1